MGKKTSQNKITIVIVGDGGVGKSSITVNFVKDEFHEVYDPTIDDSYLITVIIDEMPWQIEILDTAGQEEYRGLWLDQTLSQGDAFIITYAVNSTTSFNSIPGFLELIARSKNGHSGFRHKSRSSVHLNPQNFAFPFAIAGNKADLIHSRVVSTSHGLSLANSTGGLFYECSAKENINIQELFLDLVRSVAMIRKAAAAYRKNPVNTNRKFIANIGYQSQSLSRTRSPHRSSQVATWDSCTHPLSTIEVCDRNANSISLAEPVAVLSAQFSPSLDDHAKKDTGARVQSEETTKLTKSFCHCLIN